jgi:RNA polymerase sigma-70 factor (ECF subfamily)
MAKILPFPRKTLASLDLSDEALIAACAIGDPAALGTLFVRFNADVFRFLARVCSVGADELDDLVQKTFIEVHRSAARYRGASNVKSWLFGIAANVARHHVRSTVRRKRALEVLLQTEPIASKRPDELAEEKQLLAKVVEILPQLPHDLRVAFVLCEIEEFSGVDAAKTLGLREGTLRRRLFDARRMLRRAIIKEEP